MTKDAETMLQIGLAAAVADGRCDERERAHLRDLARSLGVDDGVLERTAADLPPDLAERLASPEACRAAYELAVAVCHVDGDTNPAEQRFLDTLRSTLGIPAEAAAAVERDARALASASLPEQVPPQTEGEAVDDLILRQAKLTAALELLPQSLATMAIIPLQMRMVYAIGRSAGQALDVAQVTDLLGAMGIGVAAQVVDSVARKIVGGTFAGILGRVLGGLAGGVASAATGSATSFATTYALGHAAQQYYAQGRTLGADDLRAIFRRLKDEAAALYPRVQGEVETQAREIDVKRLLESIRG